MAKTKISWTDYSWNPISGCSKVSDSCANCYAEAMARRFDKGWKPWTAANAAHNVRLHPERLEQPLHWRKPRKIFVCSVADLFHEHVPFGFIAAVFGVMAHTPHTYQILTKRPERMRTYFAWLGNAIGDQGMCLPCDPLGGCEIQAARHLPPEWSVGVANTNLKPSWPLPNVWLGVTAENQRAADERIPLLLQTPAAIHFVSCEPLLGSVDISRWM